MNLIIVESPTKAKTIAKFLSKDYKVESSFGHIRDLPKNEMGIDIKNNFQPKYIIPAKARKTASELKQNAAKAKKIILASDEDREGEAIAWHLAEALKLNKQKVSRIVFHEITKEAILAALTSPRDININLVDAQQARRILDRLVGYELSPFLWKKVAKGLSAGRVQSVAVRLIVEREREIQTFKTEEYWSIKADFAVQAVPLSKMIREFAGDVNSAKSQVGTPAPTMPDIQAKLNKINGKTIDKLEIKNKEQADKILNDLEGAEYIVAVVERKSVKKNPPKPFTTSTLQQTANRWLGFSAKQTMMIAQQLYEGVELPGEGGVGLITYMRTDSLNLSEKFLNDAQQYLKNNLGRQYALLKSRRFKTKTKGAQEAHEAIRPTEAARNPETIKSSLNNNQYKLYKLIWQRTLAGQMPEAIVDQTIIDINAVGVIEVPQPCGTILREDDVLANSRVGSRGFGTQTSYYQFRAAGQVIKFDGYLKIYPEKSSDVELPDVKKNEKLDLVELKTEQHFTKPPARYSDAGLVKKMEAYGIGRPSTYAPTINTIIERNYINRDENKRLFPTDIAFIVNDLLIEHFPKIVDYQFTAKMEDNLDGIAAGKSRWQPIINDFYNPFHQNLQSKYNELKKQDIMPEEKSNETCDKCGTPMIIKTGRYGKFLACSAFPECKNIKGLDGKGSRSARTDDNMNEKMQELSEKYKNEKCEKCGSDMVVKNGKYGLFLACNGYPKCKNIKNIQENSNIIDIACPVCSKGKIIEKRSRKGIFYACNQYPDCKTAFWNKPTGEKCPNCGSLLTAGKNKETKCGNKECKYKK